MDDKYQVMPPLTDEEYQRLKEDIAENGVLVPVQFDVNGNCIDGHHRMQIAEELGISYQRDVIANLDEDRADELAVSLNVARRNLTPEQKMNIAVELHERHPEWPIIKISKLTNVDQGDLSVRLQDSERSNKVESADGRYRPSSWGQVEKQQEAIRETIEEHPDWTDRQIASELGTSNSTVWSQRKKLLHNFEPSKRDEQALKDPDIVERMATDESLNVAGAIREQKRDQLVQHLESVETQEAKAVEGVYDVIVIDPPWPMERIETDANPHAVAMDYPVMDVEEIKSLNIPAADDCHVFLWATQKYLPTAFNVFESWGVKYVCCFVWHKNHGHKPFGLPKYNCEFVLYGHRGAPKFVDETQFWACFEAPITGHSEKPDVFYDMIRHVTAGRRLDMFNRRAIPGFDTWGKEAE